MSSRWFMSHARQDAEVGAVAGSGPQPTSATFTCSLHPDQPSKITGPALRVAGPGDVTAIDPSLILREEPPPGTTNAADNILVGVEFAHADLPWLLSTRQQAGGDGLQVQPWVVLVVLGEDEADPPRPADPVPLLDVRPDLLPPLDESWAWAHVEARLDDGITDPNVATAAAAAAVSTPTPTVVGRLLCARRLRPQLTYAAAVVPVPAEGAWPAPAPGATTITLPVFHWWSFHTDAAGTFKDLALRIKPNTTDTGTGSPVDVSRPWLALPAGTAASTVLDGALLPSTGGAAAETWSDAGAQNTFRGQLHNELNAPDARRTPPANGAPAPAITGPVVGPPLYGSHFTGQTTVPAAGWMNTLNLEVRRRVAAALGARYVQVEQEFLMARAWEQVGAVRNANRMLAVAELTTTAAGAAQTKHINPLDAADLVTLLAPVADRVKLPTALVTVHGLTAGMAAAPTLSNTLAATQVPAGAAGLAYSRLSRPGGALARRIDRVSAVKVTSAPVPMSTLAPAAPAQGLAPGATAPSFTDSLCEAIAPLPQQLTRLRNVINGADLVARVGETAPQRPLRPIMVHPKFTMPIAEEILSRWPDWAVPGITNAPADSVTMFETNPAFVAALLVGLNQEFNRELLWRGFPTDQRGTSFARFWPTSGDVGEIAAWPPNSALNQVTGENPAGTVVLLIRAEVLRRFPSAPLVAAPGHLIGNRVYGIGDDLTGAIPATSLALDDTTVLFMFPGLTEAQAVQQKWFFVLREPVRGTQFGFDDPVTGAPLPGPTLDTWDDLTWPQLTLHPNGYVALNPPPSAKPADTSDLPQWGQQAADMARIAFQRPFQVAFSAARLLQS
jgi:hypothetical protein